MLGNFSYYNPTKLYFGDESLNFLKDELKNYGPKVMLNYGSGSVKRNGIYDQVVAILREAGKTIVENPGVMSNPTLEKLREGVQIARDNEVDLMMALVRKRAKENDIAFQTLANHDSLQEIARGHYENAELLKGWRYGMIGHELLDLLDGKIALSISGHHLKVTRLDDQQQD